MENRDRGNPDRRDKPVKGSITRMEGRDRDNPDRRDSQYRDR
jgi:hypothetical protein